MLRIGPHTLSSPVLLAPIAGYTDLAFRLTARSCGGVGMAYTDLLCPHGIVKQNRGTRRLLATSEDDRLLGLQLYGRETDVMLRAADWALQHIPALGLIDINMGCPVDKVTKTFAGAKMLCTPDATVRLAERLVRHVEDRAVVTAKTRLGYETDERSAVPLVRRLIEAGVAAITIHGRTAAQRFKGNVDGEGIAAVVAAVHDAGGGRVPCIGNGDVRTPFDAWAMMQRTGCDGVMIAREALRAPWIFRDSNHLLRYGALPSELTLRERWNVIRRHFHFMLAYNDARYAVTKMRQWIAGYGKYLGGCKSLKETIRTMQPTDADGFDADVDRTLEAFGDEADRVPVSWAKRCTQLGGASQAACEQFRAHASAQRLDTISA